MPRSSHSKVPTRRRRSWGPLQGLDGSGHSPEVLDADEAAWEGRPSNCSVSIPGGLGQTGRGPGIPSLQLLESSSSSELGLQLLEAVSRPAGIELHGADWEGDSDLRPIVSFRSCYPVKFVRLDWRLRQSRL
jgi:hypothetical protein